MRMQTLLLTRDQALTNRAWPQAGLSGLELLPEHHPGRRLLSTLVLFPQKCAPYSNFYPFIPQYVTIGKVICLVLLVTNCMLVRVACSLGLPPTTVTSGGWPHVLQVWIYCVMVFRLWIMIYSTKRPTDTDFAGNGTNADNLFSEEIDEITVLGFSNVVIKEK